MSFNKKIFILATLSIIMSSDHTKINGATSCITLQGCPSILGTVTDLNSKTDSKGLPINVTPFNAPSRYYSGIPIGESGDICFNTLGASIKSTDLPPNCNENDFIALYNYLVYAPSTTATTDPSYQSIIKSALSAPLQPRTLSCDFSFNCVNDAAMSNLDSICCATGKNPTGTSGVGGWISNCDLSSYSQSSLLGVLVMKFKVNYGDRTGGCSIPYNPNIPGATEKAKALVDNQNGTSFDYTVYNDTRQKLDINNITAPQAPSKANPPASSAIAIPTLAECNNLLANNSALCNKLPMSITSSSDYKSGICCLALKKAKGVAVANLPEICAMGDQIKKNHPNLNTITTKNVAPDFANSCGVMYDSSITGAKDYADQIAKLITGSNAKTGGKYATAYYSIPQYIDLVYKLGIQSVNCSNPVDPFVYLYCLSAKAIPDGVIVMRDVGGVLICTSKSDKNDPDYKVAIAQYANTGGTLIYSVQDVIDQVPDYKNKNFVILRGMKGAAGAPNCVVYDPAVAGAAIKAKQLQKLN